MRKINWGIIGPGSIANAFSHSIKATTNSAEAISKYSEYLRVSRMLSFPRGGEIFHPNNNKNVTPLYMFNSKNNKTPTPDQESNCLKAQDYKGCMEYYSQSPKRKGGTGKAILRAIGAGLSGVNFNSSLLIVKVVDFPYHLFLKKIVSPIEVNGVITCL